MASEYWFYFDLYSQGCLVGRSNTFKIVGTANRIEAKLAAEEAWLTSGALRGKSFALFKAAGSATVDAYVLRDHDDSPTKG
jgi:hypothetical protein